MLTENTLETLRSMKLHGMAQALEQQRETPDTHALAFEERFGLLVDRERLYRQNGRYRGLLREAKLKASQACLEDISYKPGRGLEKSQIAALADGAWIQRGQNLLVTGPTGVGKSFIGAALAHAACRLNYHVRCFRLPRLLDELARAHAFQRRATFLRTLAMADLLLIDDFAITPLTDQSKRDLLEILDDRYDKSATIIISQLDIKQWHAYIDDPPLADALLDRVVHNAYHLD